MDLNNIERNKLDYILTDILPTELPELFTYRFFYEYLIENYSEIKWAEEKIEQLKNTHNSDTELFKGPVWANTPLKYTIMKGVEGERQISLLHPLSGIEIFLFISAYQKELLYLLEENAVFSLRYHRRNNDLCYKNKNKSVTRYFETESKNSKKDVIEHTGMFFDIRPYNSISSFTSSEEWMLLNSKYKYFARSDYKACFDSIYTHTYTWITANRVTDTKGFHNTNIYTTIDRLLMNINARSSNGIVVGPEFSRMIAELLLQRIDVIVYNRLLNNGYDKGIDYNVYRYVDDIFVFAKSEEIIDKIISYYNDASRQYLLQLNELKLKKNKMPFILEAWLKDTNLYTNRLSSLIFKSKFELREERNEIDKEDSEEKKKQNIFNADGFIHSKSTLMNHFNNLICSYSEKEKTIVSYVLGMIFNKVSRNKKQYTIFRDTVSANTVFSFIDFVLYVYSFYPDYGNSQKLLGILSYIRDEFNFTTDDHSERAQRIFSKYAFVFDKGNINDLANLLLFYRQLNVEIPFIYECQVVELLRKNDNPIQWATYLLYSTYNKKYQTEIVSIIESEIEAKIASIRNWKTPYLYQDFWWILIFNKCPYISKDTQILIDDAIDKIDYSDPQNTLSGKCNKIFTEFLRMQDKQFYEWNLSEKDFLREVTFKTHERSIFKNYGTNLNFMDWTSIP